MKSLMLEINMVVVGTLPDELFHNELHYLLKLVGICLHDVRTFVLGLDVVPWSQWSRRVRTNVCKFGIYLYYYFPDHRTKDWWLVESPGPILTILASYLFFCAYAGPNYMKDRKPFQLKTLIAAYNLFQVLFSIFITYKVSFILWFTHKWKQVHALVFRICMSKICCIFIETKTK